MQQFPVPGFTEKAVMYFKGRMTNICSRISLKRDWLEISHIPLYISCKVPFLLQLVGKMTSADFGELKRSAIDDTQTFGSDYYNASFGVEWDSGTSHLSVMGPNGDAVSITSTINL